MRKESAGRAPGVRFSGMTLLNYLVLFVVGFITFYPFWYVLMYSLSTYRDVLSTRFLVWPVGFTLENYRYVFRDAAMYSGAMNSVFVACMGTALSLVVTLLMAYPMAKKIEGISFISFLVYFTLLFGGGMIPTYLVVKQTGLINSLWSLIIPQLVNPFYLFIMRNAIKEIPDSLGESAAIDGASRGRMMWNITLPAIRSTIIIMLILRMGRILDAGFEQILVMSNALVNDKVEIIDTYVYKVGLQQARYSFSTAVNLFKSAIGLVMVLTVNTIAHRWEENML